ncbi:hypothetical protein AYO49_02750 [Verrucomicrobiaceae bacterium SCGC AG-212-N21]|nr:hypothetical protein AYO49_02750 [Verrucomicrobiaceae bacterium SCGC AG-212-N21]
MCVLLALVMSAGGRRVMAHPFDGDGSGPAKEGSSNVQAYLYVEPYTCRVECLLWLPTALEVFGMPQGDALVLAPEVKAQLIQKARTEALSWCAVKVNGVDQPLDLTASTVLRGMPGNSDVIPPNEAVGVMDAMLGLTWECSAPADIKQVEIEWKKFGPAAPGVPVTVSYGPIFEHGMVLNAAAPTGTWKNNGSLPPARALATVPPLPAKPAFDLPLGSMIWVLLVGVLIWQKRWYSPKAPKMAGLASLALVLGAAALWPVLEVSVPAPWIKKETLGVSDAQEVLQALLRNTYRAFDQRDESAVYDVLARSIHGNLLERLYVQTARALALEAQDGTRAKVSDLAVDVDSVNLLPNSDGFVATGQWTAFGRVGHWGHMHNRINKYKANMTVEPVDGAWKLTGLEVLEEVRDFAKTPGQ